MKEVYCRATRRCPSIPYKEIIEYLNKKAGKHFKHNTAKTKDFIKARWNQDFRLEDFKKGD